MHYVITDFSVHLAFKEATTGLARSLKRFSKKNILGQMKTPPPPPNFKLSQLRFYPCYANTNVSLLKFLTYLWGYSV